MTMTTTMATINDCLNTAGSSPSPVTVSLVTEPPTVTAAAATSASPATPASDADLELLKKLEEQNRLIETDMKSLNSMHSRRSSDSSSETASIASVVHEQIDAIGDNAEDLYQTWGGIIQDWPSACKKQKSFIQELVRKGIPHNLRGLIWQHLCNVQVANSGLTIREKYTELLTQSSPCEKIIKRDIPRTFPEHDYFKEPGGAGQEGLFNVMKAYSLYDAEVGYCQGSAFVVGVLLLNMPEEDTFAVFQSLMYDYRMREMFKPTMAELGLCIYQLECLVQELLPELYNHFQVQNFHTSMYASSWFLTLFTSTLPLHIANRAMDLFLSEGQEILFRLSIAILQLCRDELLKLDMESLLKFFQREMPQRLEVDPDYLVYLAVQLKIDQKKMKKLAKDYTAIKAKEQEELVELRRLRTENRLLRQKIDILEKESGELADKLIQGQICRAEEAEDNFVIKRELAALKQLEIDLRVEIGQQKQRINELEEEQKKTYEIKNEEHRLLIESLQEELIAVKLRDAENHEDMKGARERIRQLEEEIEHLRELPADHATAKLQDELLAIKLREAEANLSIKDLREKIAELKSMWGDHMSAMHPDSTESSQPNSLDTSNPNSLNNNHSLSASSGAGSITPLPSLSVTSSPMKILSAMKVRTDQIAEINKLKTELMSAKLREAEAFSELKEFRQKVMELETQNTVTMNQIRRQAEEMRRLQEELENTQSKEQDTLSTLNQEKSKFTDLDFQMKEQQMMRRIKELEQTQLVAELRQKISSLETKIEEYVTHSKLTQSAIEPSTSGELQDRMAELQTEMFRLDVTNKKLQSMQAFNGNSN